MIKVLEFDGHIRNWKALCEEFGFDLTLSREEREEKIIIEAYKRWDKDMAEHLHGMFSFAIQDDEKDRIFCLRDQFGAKPFYYYVTDDNNLLFSSSITKIVKQPGFKKEFNDDMLQLYLTFTYAPGENTFFKGLKKLRPGSYLIWKDNKLTVERYFRPVFEPDESKSLDEWVEEIKSTVNEIMDELNEEERKTLSFLSSGVDSSYVTAMADIDMCLTCGYENFPLDESAQACETAKGLNKECKIGLVTPDKYFECIPYVMTNMEQPLGDASAPAFALSCREAAKYGEVCYSGEGSDEFFAGYNMHRRAETYGDKLSEFYIGNTNIMKEDEKQELLNKYNPDLLPIDAIQDAYKETKDFSPLGKMLAVDIDVWLDGDIYLNVDKMSQAAGIEVRMPLTDTRIFEIARRLPDNFKIHDDFNKYAFRLAADTVLPEGVAFRRKLGFVVPIRKWLADSQYNGDVLKRLHGDAAKKFFSIEKIDSIYDEYINVNSDHWRKIWNLYAFLVWYEEYFEKI